MKEELIECKYCHCKSAQTYKIDGLWYVRCKGKKKTKNGEFKPCTSWPPYEFLALKEKDAIDNWNNRNTMEGKGYKRKGFCDV